MPSKPDSKVQQSSMCKTKVCISNLFFAEKSTDPLQALTEALIRTKVQASAADSQVSPVKGFSGQADRPGILISNCRSVQHRNAALKGAENLQSRPFYDNPNYTKLQAHAQLPQPELSMSFQL